MKINKSHNLPVAQSRGGHRQVSSVNATAKRGRRKSTKARAHVAKALPTAARYRIDADRPGPNESEQAALARLSLRPATQNGITIADYTVNTFAAVSLNGTVDELKKQVAAVNAGDLKAQEALLTAQSFTLDAMFNELGRRALRNMNAGGFEVGERLLKLALRAQSQSRATIETLSVVKNPQAVAFVRQANIANGPQQVNNGAAVPIARVENGNRPSEQSRLTHDNGQSLDCETPAPAVTGNPPLEAMAILEWTKDR